MIIIINIILELLPFQEDFTIHSVAEPSLFGRLQLKKVSLLVLEVSFENFYFYFYCEQVVE